MCPLLSRGLWLPPPHEPQALALAISLDSEQLRVLGLADLGGGAGRTRQNRPGGLPLRGAGVSL